MKAAMYRVFKLVITAVPLLGIYSANILHANSVYQEIYELKGICNLHDQWMASIHNNSTGGGNWLKAGQKIGNLTFEDFDQTTELARFSYKSEVFTLSLKANNESTFSTMLTSKLPAQALEEIESKVADYESGIKKILLDPDKIPSDSNALAKRVKEITTLVSNYREKLINEHQSQLETALTLNSSDNTNIGLQIRKRNRVNSRIWASDHVRDHGAPEGAEYLVREYN